MVLWMGFESDFYMVVVDSDNILLLFGYTTKRVQSLTVWSCAADSGSVMVSTWLL